MIGPIGTGLTHIRHILHPTDFSPGSMAAFGHALKLGLDMKSDLTIMHVDSVRADPDFENFPRVRATLSRWGVFREGASKDGSGGAGESFDHDAAQAAADGTRSELVSSAPGGRVTKRLHSATVVLTTTAAVSSRQ